MEYYDEQTLSKVRDALSGNQGDGIQLADDVVTDLIRRMQNEGILFRQIETAEQASKRIIEEVTSSTEVSEWQIPEEMLLTRDQGIRVQALDITVRSFPVPHNLSIRDITDETIIKTAEKFEDYIRNGVIHNG